jgi:hypothetical protein
MRAMTWGRYGVTIRLKYKLERNQTASFKGFASYRLWAVALYQL